ncbi:hypothetical protein HanPSC8_Chr17g0794781 [Helianthus annuus]|nr:hypothetical protein HanIR_Chr17g0899131 [Helianthus annuus]KAJ0815197.1 hypothetical protein HanPSC8_Chr17g0794781 [Helianthus annuus]
MRIAGSNNTGKSKKKVSSKLGGILKEQKARLYIIRRCVIFFRYVLEISCGKIVNIYGSRASQFCNPTYWPLMGLNVY